MEKNMKNKINIAYGVAIAVVGATLIVALCREHYVAVFMNAITIVWLLICRGKDIAFGNLATMYGEAIARENIAKAEYTKMRQQAEEAEKRAVEAEARAENAEKRCEDFEKRINLNIK